jgi:phosphatidylserine decarboxylase
MKYFNRQKSILEDEEIFGEKILSWLYPKDKDKKNFLIKYVVGKLCSKIYGYFQSSIFSQFQILPFIEKYKIDLKDFIHNQEPDHDEIFRNYKSFNEFFGRKFLLGKRSFPLNQDTLGAFVEGRYLAYESWSEEIIYPVKGEYLNPIHLIRDEKLAQDFLNGPMIIARLAPCDYHRFHFPDDGKILSHFYLPGHLHSVSPIALQKEGKVFQLNERQVTLLKTENFGEVIMIEVGAFCVGKIIQTFSPHKNFKRGDEKGYFHFGASTVICLFKKGSIKIHQDIIEMTNKKIETLIRLGNPIAEREQK